MRAPTCNPADFLGTIVEYFKWVQNDNMFILCSYCRPVAASKVATLKLLLILLCSLSGRTQSIVTPLNDLHIN